MAGFDKVVYEVSLLIIYLGLGLAIFAGAIFFVLRIAREVIKLLHLKKHSANPVISPTQGSGWDEVGTFNPAAYLDGGGNVHLIYRAIGDDGMSRFGYAFSGNGQNFQDKSPYPVFSMQNPRRSNAPRKFDPVMYPSGGSWGGSEDPRMVRIGDKIYVTFSAFDGWDFIRMAVISILEKDFLAKKWNWSKPILISPPGKLAKNWVLFPEKINGKFAVLHSIVPQILIEYVDNLNSSTQIESPRLYGPQPGPEGSWDNWIRGAGPPPIKTERGWLLLYHALTNGKDGYRLGAMLLDLDNPEKVIARSREPILAPEEWYENDWKPGIVYACGAVVKDGILLVYYGGGDKHVCVASLPLSTLLDSFNFNK